MIGHEDLIPHAATAQPPKTWVRWAVAACFAFVLGVVVFTGGRTW